MGKGETMMKNQVFDIIFDSERGGISSLILSGDNKRMNFCRDGRSMFALRNFTLESFKKLQKLIK